MGELVERIVVPKNEKKEKLTLTPKEAAAVLGIGINKMYELVHSKGFPVITVGNRKLIVKSKFTEWLENNIGSEF